MDSFKRFSTFFLLAIILFGTIMEPLSVFAENPTNANGHNSNSMNNSPGSNPSSPSSNNNNVTYVTREQYNKMVEEAKREGRSIPPLLDDTEPKSMPDPGKKGDYYPIPMDKTGRLYGNPKDLMAKTDFIMNIMKVEKVIPGRMFLNRVPYSRLTTEGQYKTILTEPVETSPYQEYMGTMGIDTGQTDVIISHQIFGMIDYMSNSNVPELYLVAAYQKGLFDLTELNTTYGENPDGKELKEYLGKFYSPEKDKATDITPRWKYMNLPIQRGFKRVKVSDKIIEYDNAAAGQYPQQYFKKWREVVSEVSNWEPPTSFMKGSKFWGNSYIYANRDTNNKLKFTLADNMSEEEMQKFDSLFNQTSISIVKRKSILFDKEGYQYFNDETMTVMDAYKMVYKMLLSMEGEKELSDAEVDYINSAYQMNMSNFLPDEIKACKYLIAKGIIDGEDLNLYQAANIPLTNAVAIDLMYKMKNKAERLQITPQLSDVEHAMVKKGYSQVNIGIKNGGSNLVPVHLSDPVVDDKGQNEPAEGYDTVKSADNNYAYEYIFIRIPKVKDEKGNEKHMNYHLRVNDEFRTPLKGFEFKEGDTPIQDANGYTWRLYTVHKDTASDLVFTGVTDDLSDTFQIPGINGGGFYWAPDDKVNERFSKWDIKEFTSNASIRAFLTESPTSNGKNDKLYNQIKKLLEFRTRQSAEELSPKMTRDMLSKPTASIKKVENKIYMSGDNKVDIKTQLAKSGLTKISEDEFKKLGMKSIDNLLEAVSLGNAGIETANDLHNSTSVFDENGNINKELYQRKTYGAKDPKKDRSEIIYGPVTKDQLQTLKYGGQNLVGFADGQFRVDINNPVIKANNEQNKYNVRPVQVNGETRYEIAFKPETADYKVEMAKFTRHLSSGQEDGGKKFSGFAKLEDNNGNPLIMISKAQLAEFKVEALSDKLLLNTETGQRAFIDTDDHMTLIGNNITHYSDDEMMVNAFGAEGGSKDKGVDQEERNNKIFYNLDIVLELLNSTKIVQQVAGKNIYHAKEEGEFKALQVYNREDDDGMPNANLSIATTYIYNTKDNRTYINLSSLTGMTSNFIYYKNRKHDVNSVDALIVYHPRDEYVQYSGKTDNTLSAQMITGSDSDKDLKIKDAGEDIADTDKSYLNVTPEMVKNKAEAEKVKAAILSKLLLGSTDKPGDTIGENYTYDIYLFEKQKSQDGGKDITANFLAAVFGKEDKKLFDGFERITDKIDPADKSKADAKNKYKDIRLGVVKAALTEASGEAPKVTVLSNKNQMSDYENNFLIQESTGNLYFYMGNKTGENISRQATAYQKIFGQNMYFDNNNERLLFRMRHYYQNTPKNWIPLERYGEGSGSFGSMSLPSGYTYRNFETPKKDGGPQLDRKAWKYDFKLPYADLSTTYNSNSNVAILGNDSGKKNNVGLFTKLELPYKELKLDTKSNTTISNKGIDLIEVKKFHKPMEDIDAENLSNYSERAKQHKTKPTPKPAELTVDITPSADKNAFTKRLFDLMLYDFDQALNKNRDPEFANQEAKDEYRTFDVVQTYKDVGVGPLNNQPEFMRDLMQGTWDSILDINDTYVLSRNLEDVGIKGVPDGEEFIVITSGQPTSLKQYPRMIRKNKKGSIMALKLTAGNPRNQALDILTSSKSDLDKRITEIQTVKDLVKFSEDGKIKVFYKPSLAIPHGTNVVDEGARIRTLPHPIPREEIPYAADIINSLLFRITLNNETKYDNKTFLYQIEEGSVVDFGNGDYFVKSTPKQKENKRLKWVNMISATSNKQFNIKGYEAEDFIVMSRFLSSMGNRIKIGYNIGKHSVPLKSILGKGMYVVPHADLLTEVSKLGVDNGNGELTYKAIDAFSDNPHWVRYTSGEVDRDAKVKTYGIRSAEKLNGNDPSKVTFKVDKNEDESSLNQHILTMQLYMPPTIEVEPIKDPNNKAHYKVIMYHDVKGFMVDKDDSYVSYLKSRDTDASEVLDEISQLRVANLDGMKYENFAKVRYSDSTMNNIKSFVLGVVPLLLVFLVILINCAWVILQSSMLREKFTDMSKRLGWGIGERLENGWLSPATLPSYSRVVVISVMLVMFAILIGSGAIFNVAGKLFFNIQQLPPFK